MTVAPDLNSHESEGNEVSRVLSPEVQAEIYQHNMTILESSGGDMPSTTFLFDPIDATLAANGQVLELKNNQADLVWDFLPHINYPVPLSRLYKSSSQRASMNPQVLMVNVLAREKFGSQATIFKEDKARRIAPFPTAVIDIAGYDVVPVLEAVTIEEEADEVPYSASIETDGAALLALVVDNGLATMDSSLTQQEITDVTENDEGSKEDASDDFENRSEPQAARLPKGLLDITLPHDDADVTKKKPDFSDPYETYEAYPRSVDRNRSYRVIQVLEEIDDAEVERRMHPG